MTRTLIFMVLMAMSMLTTSCFLICRFGDVTPLTQTVAETLKLVKKEVNSTISLTTEQVKSNEVDFHVGNEIIDSLRATMKQIDSLMFICDQLEKTGTREEILLFAERTNQVTINALTNLKSLRDLYDISTLSLFETANFFAADSCNIPPEKTGEAKKAIEPVAQRIARFLGDHPLERFEVVIACSSTYVGHEPNDTLCVARSHAVAYLLIDHIRSYSAFIPHPERIRYNIKWLNKGEGLPSSSRKKLPEDNHRSMVSLTWNVLPVSYYSGAVNR